MSLKPGLTGKSLKGLIHFVAATILGGIFRPTAVSSQLTLTGGFTTPPTFTALKDDGKVVIRTLAAYTGSFEVVAQG